MSAPAAKALSLPVMTMAPMPSSASKALSARPSSSMSCGLSAFSCFGRLRVMTPTRPFFSVLISSAMAFFELRKRDGTRYIDAFAIRLDGAQRFDFLHRAGAALREVLVQVHVVLFPAQLLLGQGTQHARGNSGHKGSRRNFLLRLDEGERGDHRFLADLGVVVHHGIHADQRAAAHDAAVQHRAMPYRDVGADHGVLAGKAVQHAGILDIRALLDD